MPLDKTKLNTELNKAYVDSWNTFIGYLIDNSNSKNPSTNPRPAAIDAAAKIFADQVANSIDMYIKSAEIVVPPGTDVTVKATTTGTSDIKGTGITPADVASTITSATYAGKSISDSPKAKIS